MAWAWFSVFSEDDLTHCGLCIQDDLILWRGTGMSWMYLLTAGVLEVIWAYSMKQSLGFTRLTPSLVTLAAMGASFWLLALAMRSLPLGLAYSIWVGIGAIGAFLVGIAWLGEPANALRLVAAALIVAGLILMALSSS